MQNYFGSINHQCLRVFLDRRIKDGVIRKMIDKWLKAGVLDNGQLVYPIEGTSQGGTLSPLISNLYLHYVLDEWFVNGGTVCRKAARTGLWGSGEATNRSTRNCWIEDLLKFKGLNI
jgi:hypothetical protein